MTQATTSVAPVTSRVAPQRAMTQESRFAGLTNRLRTYWDGLKPLPATSADHDYFNVFLRSRRDLEALLPVPLAQARMMVMGCGYRYPDVLLYSTCAHEAVGLDVRSPFYRDGWLAQFHQQRRVGKSVTAAFYNAVAERRGLSRYYRRLRRYCAHELAHAEARLNSYDGGRSAFPDGHFDAAISNAVLQHVMDLPAFFAEAARLTRPGGITYHVLHNYCSFSGSLREEWFCRRYPWGHLRGIYRTNPRHLNGVRVEAMRHLLAEHFEVLDVVPLAKNHARKGEPDFAYEHPELLTPSLRSQLAGYPEEELLTRSYLLIGRKR